MNAEERSEELLRATLTATAEEVSSTLTLDDVRRHAADSRRRSRHRSALIMAAAAIVVAVVPVALLRTGGTSPSPAPPPSAATGGTGNATASSSPSPSPTQTVPPSDLTQIARGPGVTIPWLAHGVIHEPGHDDVTLPDVGAVTAFTNYHGGWLVSGSGAWQVGGDGRTEMVAQSGGGIVVSGDGMQTAFLANDAVRIGITTGMGEGETVIPFQSPDPTGPVGFLSGGRVACNGLKGQLVALDPSGRSRVLGGLYHASGSTDRGDLIAGTTVDDDGTAAVVTADGKTLWTKPGWQTGQFSPDGRHLAAYRSATGGEFETVAILDAHSGKVLTTNATLTGIRALPAVPPAAWDEDGGLLIPYRDGSAWTIVRLGLDGTTSRATPVFEGNPTDAGLVFAARP
jgi:hypothetical protein